MKKLIAFVFLVLSVISIDAQVTTNIHKLRELSEKLFNKNIEARQKVNDYSIINNVPIRIENDSILMELMLIDERGYPQYYIIHNENAAKTISTNKVYSGGVAGLSLSGSGVTLYEWDGGTVLSTHQEFDTRVTNEDATATHYHATHVAGTIMASGIQSAAKGMAYAASLEAYDWTNDESEMASAAANGAEVSNHSYGTGRGWVWDGSAWSWYGNPSVSTSEDYLFGFYNSWSADWDDIAYNAPYYLIVKSAGNDRGDGPSGGTYPQDGPYDCIGPKGIAKNVLTVGAVSDITGGWTQPSDVIMSSFSSWGPADDGRIKPDIVANGINLYSTYNTGNTDYNTLSGTSMSSPSVTGSIGLLMEHYENVNGTGTKMRAATKKALIIHTADEAGTTIGPDYQFGWGLMNTESAAAKITENQTADVIIEYYLAEGETYTREITTTGTSPIKVTVVWTDPAGTPVSASLDPTDIMLVNDLDVKVTQASDTYYPWKLDASNPAGAATQNSENNVDNVEQVYIASPLNSTTYTITVDHDGTLTGGGQAFSMILSGDIDYAVAPDVEFTADITLPGIGQTVIFTDNSFNTPTSWSWSFTPSTVTYVNGTSSTSQNPQVQFSSDGYYTVQLSATNIYGSDTESKNNYILVSSLQSYCSASGGGDEFISGVQIGSINNQGTLADSYSDYTDQSTNVTINQSYNITLNFGVAYNGDDIGIWIDFNQDGDFDDTGENVVCQVGITNLTENYAITIPEDAELGNTTMRIRIKYDGTDCGNSCGTTSFGEVEDYKVVILPANDTWIGNTNEWNYDGNWSDNNVPTQSYNVTIPSSPTGGNFPIIPFGTNGKCNTLTLESGASITINGTLEIEE